MSNYILSNGEFYNKDELTHYGVLGMRWGVRRATKRLSKATTSEQRDKAVASLNKHRAKATKKVEKLAAKHPKLEKAYDKAVTKIDPKIAKLETKKAKLRRRAGSIFTSERQAEKLLIKRNTLDMKIEGLKARSHEAKAAIAKNDHMTSLFKQGIADIDSALASAGKKYVNG